MGACGAAGGSGVCGQPPCRAQGPGEERGMASAGGEEEERRKWFIWQSCPGAKTRVKPAGGLNPKSS